MTWAELGTLGVAGYRAVEAGQIARANNSIRRSANKQATINATATNWMRGVTNKAIAEAAASTTAAFKETLARTQDAQTADGLSKSIADMEQAGAIAAGAVAAGMAGLSVETLERTNGLRSQMADEAIRRTNGQTSYELTKQIAGTASAGVLEQDLSVALPQLDFRRDRAINPWTAIFTDAASAKALANLSTAVGKARFDWFGNRPPTFDAGSTTQDNLG